MPRGAPDYSNVRVAEPLHRLDDLAEVATRLHSPVVYDRAGKVVFLSRFGNGLGQFGLTAAGSGAVIAASPTTFLTGPFAMKMTTSNVKDEVSTAWVRVPILEDTTRLGLETAFCIPDGEVGLAIQISVYLPPKKFEYTLKYKTDTDELSFVPWGPGGVLEEDLKLYEGVAAWHRMKLVVDLETQYYVRVLLNENVYNIPEYPGYKDTTGEDRRIDIRLQGWARENATKVIYWDDVVVTQHEP